MASIGTQGVALAPAEMEPAEVVGWNSVSWASGDFGFDVDSVRQPVQQVICLFLFVKRMLQKLRGFGIAKQFGIGTSSSVTGNLVVFNSLCSGDQSGIQYFWLSLRDTLNKPC